MLQFGFRFGQTFIFLTSFLIGWKHKLMLSFRSNRSEQLWEPIRLQINTIVAYIYPALLKVFIPFHLTTKTTTTRTKQCLDEAKEEKDLEREELNDTERSCEITFKALLNQLSDDLLDEVVWKESADSSTKRPEVFSRTTWKVWSGMQSLTLSTQRGRLLLLWTSSTLSSDKARPSTDSVVKQLNSLWRSTNHINPAFLKATKVSSFTANILA